MKIFTGFSNLTKLKLVIIAILIVLIMPIFILWINPAARKGPFGFGPPSSNVTFLASDGSYSILYPQNWTVFETPKGNHGDDKVIADILVAGHQAAYISVARQSFPNGSIDSVLSWGQSRAAILNGFKSISLYSFTDVEYSGYLHEYSTSYLTIFGDKKFNHCQDMYVFENDTGYSLSFCSNEEDWSVLQSYYLKMQQSFSFTAKNK